jgi:hypothetical protein
LFKLGYGDRAIYPQVATQCIATGEAGQALLLCEPTAKPGPHEVGFYRDEVLVYRGPEHFSFSGPWNLPRRRVTH